MVEQDQQHLEQPIPRPLALDIGPDFLRVFYVIDQQRVRSCVEVFHPRHARVPAKRLDRDAVREGDQPLLPEVSPQVAEEPQELAVDLDLAFLIAARR
jgi:hypothetical protein